MRKPRRRNIKPYISLLTIVLTLFVMVFFKMETRRLGYTALKLNKKLSVVKDEYRYATITYAKKMRADRVKKLAVSHLTLTQAQKGQIIQLSGADLALTY